MDAGRAARGGWRGERFWLVAIAVFAALLVAGLLAVDRLAPAGRGVVKITGVDPLAYYGVARSLVYDGDVDLANEYAELGADSVWLDEVPATGRRGSPFPVGYSLFQVPFLALARVLGEGAGRSPDGFERLSVAFFYLGNIAAACLGLALLLLFLADLARWLGVEAARAPPLAAAAALAAWAGTTAGYYTFSPMPHVVAFFAMALFLALWWRQRSSDSVAGWTGVGLAFGFLVLCRWQALLYAVVPLGWDLAARGVAGAARPRSAPRAWLASRGAGALAALAVFVPQMLEWKAIYGRWITIPQGAGFFELPPRYALKVLFSTHHGWFVWTPLALVGVTGLVVLATGGWSGGRVGPPPQRERLAVAIPFLLAIAAQVALVGSLPSSWYNRHSFSIRMLTAATPLVAAGLAVLLAGRGVLRRVAATAMVLSLAWTLVFAIEFRLDITPRDDRLTAGELVTDKLLLRAAWGRYRAVRAARRARSAGEHDRCVEITTNAIERHGADRRLLLLSEFCHWQRGDESGAAEARRRLEAILAHRLY